MSIQGLDTIETISSSATYKYEATLIDELLMERLADDETKRPIRIRLVTNAQPSWETRARIDTTYQSE